MHQSQNRRYTDQPNVIILLRTLMCASNQLCHWHFRLTTYSEPVNLIFVALITFEIKITPEAAHTIGTEFCRDLIIAAASVWTR